MRGAGRAGRQPKLKEAQLVEGEHAVIKGAEANG
jgi:hypothetical protein